MWLEIISHVWCPPGLDIYAKLLRMQFASLVHHPPPEATLYTICFSSEDKTTSRTVRELLEVKRPETLNLLFMDSKPGELFRRAHLRNQRAINTEAEIVWFTDVDYLFGEGCLEDVLDQVDRYSNLVCPKYVYTCKSHSRGQMLIDTMTEKLPRIDPQHFTRRKQHKGIGGIQIVGSELLHKIGYLNRSPGWSDATTEENGFRSCRCDRRFRAEREIELPPPYLPIRSVYRMRHAVRGRDYNRKGEHVGTKSWH